MRVEQGVAIVLWKKSGSRRRYAVLHRKKNWEGWEVPKGHLEETPRQTAKLEIEEETGIEEEQINEIESTDLMLSWTFQDDGEKVEKEYECMIVKAAKQASIDVSENPHKEHDRGFFLQYEDAHSLLTYDNQKELLAEAHRRITDNKDT